MSYGNWQLFYDQHFMELCFSVYNIYSFKIQDLFLLINHRVPLLLELDKMLLKFQM